MKNKYRFGIRSKITIGYVVIIICLLTAVLVLNSQIRSLQKERNDLIEYNTSMQTLTNTIEKHIMDMQAGQRGYIITGNESYLEPYNRASEEWEKRYQELYALIENEPAQLKQLEKAKESIEVWISEAGERAISLKRENNTEGIQAFYANDLGREYMNSIRAQFDSFRSSQIELTQARADELDERNNLLTVALFGILVSVSVIAIIMASQVSKAIVRTISDVTDSITNITTDSANRKERIIVKTNDEIRELAIATNNLLDKMDNREWLQSNIAEIVTNYQGVSSINALSNIFLSQLARMTDSSYGAFYIREANEQDVYFYKKAAYADSSTEDGLGRDSFRLGQGLIGQCAKDKKILLFHDVPTDYTFVSTGLGQVPPSNILIVPVLFEDEVIAVVELATLKEYSELHQDLVKQVVETFGLSVNSVLGRMEVVRLLSESRAMTEELQAQSEELQTQSEELQTQSEELQMQTEELTQINEQLEERTKDAETKTAELEIIRKELEEKAEQLLLHSNYKSEFLANMSHELRTPLNSILILSEMLSENGKGRLTEEEMEFAKVIHSSGEDLLSLINDILDLSKVEAGKLEVLFEEVNLNELPNNMERTFQPVAQSKNLEFKVWKDDNVPDLFYTDEKRFQQILKNLLSNAFKFTEAGLVELVIKRVDKEKQTREMKKTSEEWIQFSVKDTGIGIPPEKHEFIFESFQQADGATVRKYGGTGLGLSICREFAKLLGGWITLESTVGEGSIFTLVIPSLPDGLDIEQQLNLEIPEVAVTTVEEDLIVTKIPTPEKLEDIQLHPEDTDVFENKNILIVDDDHRNIYALKTALERRGMNILVARDGLECLDVMQSNEEIDIVLMDIMMPNMDGFETMSKIRNDLQMTDIPIIALTAKAMKNDRDKCLEAGASDYISKPLNLDQLFSVLRVWLVS